MSKINIILILIIFILLLYYLNITKYKKELEHFKNKSDKSSFMNLR